MGLTEAKKYIQDLRKKQSNPFLWPDYLTGLPDKSAIIKKIDEVFSKLGEYSVAYLRIDNIKPYILKYGPSKHAEIIQWAAAVLKTSSDKFPNSFVGTLNAHDFIAICETKDMVAFIEEARELFRKKAATYYSKNDLAKGVTLSFDRNDGKKVNLGLMKFVAVVVNRKLRLKRSRLILEMARMCDAIEGTEEDIAVMSNAMILRD
jgi:GGDEF domain-containing protein